MCWGNPLYCEQCVFKKRTKKYIRAVCFMEALKPFIGLFDNGSIISFALVRGKDSESFLCNEFLCRCGVVITWYHITVGWRASRGEPGVFEPLNVSAQPWEGVRWDNGDMTNPYRTLLTFLWSGLSQSLTFTGLRGYLHSSNRFAVSIREWQGYYCVVIKMWKDSQDDCSKHSLTLLKPPKGNHLQKMWLVFAIECICLC